MTSTHIDGRAAQAVDESLRLGLGTLASRGSQDARRPAGDLEPRVLDPWPRREQPVRAGHGQAANGRSWSSASAAAAAGSVIT